MFFGKHIPLNECVQARFNKGAEVLCQKAGFVTLELFTVVGLNKDDLHLVPESEEQVVVVLNRIITCQNKKNTNMQCLKSGILSQYFICQINSVNQNQVVQNQFKLTLLFTFLVKIFSSQLYFSKLLATQIQLIPKNAVNYYFKRFFTLLNTQ
ncbi:Hypothetical_protein [Hexamita inflata]|uniref:Hypothetical_protein n=1 Tax=Hexamita inflata TaxID=28002 RepID=A0AA86R7W2_9EUKA|nr:Hypothetical protein HINF_LOCUS58767 [Hexamita inflata]